VIRRLRLTFWVLCWVSFLAGIAWAESETRRLAEEMLEAIETPDSQFTDRNVKRTVTPFETSRPKEADLDPSEFDDEILKTRTGSDDQSRALQASEDSLLSRPDIAIDPDAPLLDSANSAHENADALVGGYFEAGSGTCEDPSILSTGFVEHFCQKRQLEETKSCTLTRNIAVDRREWFDCEQQDAQYIRTCTKSRILNCRGASGGTCRKDAVALSKNQIAENNGSITWGVSLSHQSGCVVKEKSFQIILKDSFQPSLLKLARIDHAGFAQVEVDGVIIGTWPSGGTEGKLGIATFGCGKNCSVVHPVINGAAIGDCTSASQTAKPNADLLDQIVHAVQFTLGSSLSGARSTRITIRTVFRDAAPDLLLKVSYGGACCTDVSSSWETSCTDPSR